MSQNRQTSAFTELKKKNFDYLIRDSYGSAAELATILDLGIEMLFYLEENTFDKREVQGVVSAIRDIIGELRKW